MSLFVKGILLSAGATLLLLSNGKALADKKGSPTKNPAASADQNESQIRKEVKELSASLDRLADTFATKAKDKTEKVSKATKENVEQSIDSVKNKIAEISKQIDDSTESAKKSGKEKISNSIKDIRSTIDDLAEKIDGQ